MSESGLSGSINANPSASDDAAAEAPPSLPHPGDGFRTLAYEKDNRIGLAVQLYANGEPVWLMPQPVLDIADTVEGYPVRSRQRLLADAICRWFTLGGSQPELEGLLEAMHCAGLGKLHGPWEFVAVENCGQFSYIFQVGDRMIRWLEDEFVEEVPAAALLDSAGDDG